ncbi:serine/threonine protein kinase [pteropodid alphaherpesvirus 2]|uniref:non-specific serine/threonine protein kinase n=1 Tax=pteropodid alphaherpesvirus 2 TaxID=3118716 RepID=A0A510J735_9ALPH|nr:serine/threonine protein kinase [pteropodid alphaherpesvirus 2]BBM13235.1 serine/threonine protein kinase [pteropodid alphaherpesvirus 2]
MSCRKFRRVYANAAADGGDGWPSAAGAVLSGPLGAPSYTAGPVGPLPLPATHPTQRHDSSEDESTRLRRIQDLLAEMRQNDRYSSEDDDDGHDDVAFPDPDDSGRTPNDDDVAMPSPRALGPSHTAPRGPLPKIPGPTGFTPAELSRMDREAAHAIRRGCKPPSQMAVIVTDMGFTIHKALTPGSEGCVFESSHPSYPQRVIVKAGWYTSTHHEASLLRRMRHPSILTLLDIHAASGITCLVLPKYQSDLYTFLGARVNPLGIPEVRSISKQLLSAIGYIHREGIIHRDIKTENVFINNPDDVCLGDFGAACFVRGPWTSSFQYGIAGTVDTNAPEVLAGDAYTPSVDIWSAGLVIFEVAVYNASLFSGPASGERRPCESQIMRIIRQAQVHMDEFPKQFHSRLTTQYRYRAANNTRPPYTRPAWTRHYKLPLDVEYVICRALTFDGSLRPSSDELLQLPLFQSK